MMLFNALGRFWLVTVVLLAPAGSLAWSQETSAENDPRPNAQREAEADALAEAALMDDAAATEAVTEGGAPQDQQLNALELFFKGGVLMYPIAFMSFLVVAFSIERALALRRRRIMPPVLTRELRQLKQSTGGFDARAAARLCDDRGSVLARVMCAALARLGRPTVEIERAIDDACQREAAKLYKNVRPITLAITITPLIGLLGTVQGMIQAFFVTSVSPIGVNKAQSLAEGIYTALVTTFAGLAVAIPAAVLAHYFEGKIHTLLEDVEEFMGEWLPQFERVDAKSRPPRGEVTAPPVHESARVTTDGGVGRLQPVITVE